MYSKEQDEKMVSHGRDTQYLNDPALYWINGSAC